MNTWKLYDPEVPPRAQPLPLPPAPAWRTPGGKRAAVLATTFRPHPELVDAVNTALYLRRPLLLTGKPGTGKSSLAYSVAKQMGFSNVIEWAVNSRTSLQDGLYRYDALARLQHIQRLSASRSGDPEPDADDARELGIFLTLGPLGAALAAGTTRVLLVDEIDKSDADLPNDLLNVLDTGHFGIPELQRVADRHPCVPITTPDGEQVIVMRGEVTFSEFPFVVMTSNGERDFPAPFLRRCVQCEIPEPNAAQLREIVAAHFPQHDLDGARDIATLIEDFVRQRASVALATDQLLNAIHLLNQPLQGVLPEERSRLLQTLFQGLG